MEAKTNFFVFNVRRMMMKKVLILCAVLSLAAVSNGAWSLAISGPYDDALTDPTWVNVTDHTDNPLKPDQLTYHDPMGECDVEMEVCDFMWIGVYNDTDYSQEPGTGQDTLYLALKDDGTGEWTGGYAYYPEVMPDLAPPNGYIGNQYFGLYGGYLVFKLGLTYLEPTTTPIGIGVPDAKEFHCMAEGDAIIELWDESLSKIDEVVIHQIPEPMTVTLLSLGGLFLRRRR
jgi:hypothetical protein